MSTFIASGVKSIDAFTSGSIPVRVQPFQRSYSWTDKGVKQLWLDIIKAVDSNQLEYFLRHMVSKKTSDYLEIFDEQHRVIALFILLSF